MTWSDIVNLEGSTGVLGQIARVDANYGRAAAAAAAAAVQRYLIDGYEFDGRLVLFEVGADALSLVQGRY